MAITKRKFQNDTVSLWRNPKRFKYAKNDWLTTFDTIATGFDMVHHYSKTGNKTEKKHTKTKQKELAAGWYVDYITGLKHKFPKSWETIITQNGRQQSRVQTPIKINGILSRIANLTILQTNSLTDFNNILPLATDTIDCFITTGRWKITWTNMSNVKMCYEFYYVTPKKAGATSFEQQIPSFGDPLTNPDGLDDVFTTWKPTDYPQLMRNWRILGKSVFRLGAGESAELHGKDAYYYKFGLAQRLTQRNYTENVNTQLYVRVYGCPTGTAAIGTESVKDSVFSDHNIASNFIVEQSINYYYADTVNKTATSWSSTVKAAPDAGDEVVVQADTSEDVTPAK